VSYVKLFTLEHQVARKLGRLISVYRRNRNLNEVLPLAEEVFRAAFRRAVELGKKHGKSNTPLGMMDDLRVGAAVEKALSDFRRILRGV